MKNPLPHQIEDAQFLADRKFAGCFSGMGSGKTITALEAVRLCNKPRVVIVAPPIALAMWAETFADQLGGSAQILSTGKTKIQDTDAVVCSYEIATKRADELREWHQGGIVICDESHALKNVKAKRTQAILGKHGLCCGASHAWMLTGTPVTRWNDDLYPFLCRADLSGLKQRCGGSEMTRYSLRYTITQQKRFSSGQLFPTTVTVGNKNTEELNAWIYGEGLAVRRELKEVWDAMPPLTVNTYRVKLDASADLKAKLKELSKKSVSEIQRDLQSKEPALATIRRELGIAKAKAAAAEIIERVESGVTGILVGAWHTDVIDEIVAQLRSKKIRVEALDGRTSAANKTRLQNQFNNGELDVLVGQISAMGVSLNLQQGGNTIIVAELDWSPAVMDQFYARLHRFGQEKHVHVDILQADTPLEEAVARISNTKRREHATLNRQEAS